MVAEQDIRDCFQKHLENDDRSLRWFHEKIKKELQKDGKTISYSKIYYTFKKVHQLDEESKALWNRILGTSY